MFSSPPSHAEVGGFTGQGHPKEPWCHVESDLLTTDEVYRFPFAILEIKLQNVSETPMWLRQTLVVIGFVLG